MECKGTGVSLITQKVRIHCGLVNLCAWRTHSACWSFGSGLVTLNRTCDLDFVAAWEWLGEGSGNPAVGRSLSARASTVSVYTIGLLPCPFEQKWEQGPVPSQICLNCFYIRALYQLTIA